MNVRDLRETQLKELYCAACGWHVHLKEDAGSPDFDEFYDAIKVAWDDDGWLVNGKRALMDIRENLTFRIGLNYIHEGIGGMAFDLKAVFETLKRFGVL